MLDNPDHALPFRCPTRGRVVFGTFPALHTRERNHHALLLIATRRMIVSLRDALA